MRYLSTSLFGFGEYTTHEKIMVFFLSLLIFYFLSGHARKDLTTKKDRSVPGLYFLITTLLLLFPLTAALLLRYQTLVYTYGYLWAMIPLVPVISYGATQLLFRYRSSQRVRPGKEFFFVIALSLILFLCSDMFQDTWKEKELIAGESAESTAKMDQLCEKILSYTDHPVLLASPSEMEYARIYTGSIKVVYGRNLWDESMNVFTDDRYSGSEKEYIPWLRNYMSYGAFYSYYSNNVPIFCAPYRDVDMDCLEEETPLIYKGYSILQDAVNSGANVISLPVIYCNDVHVLLNSEDYIYSVGASDAMGYNFRTDTQEDSILTDQIGLSYMAQFLGADLYEEDVDEDGKLDHYFLVIPEGTISPGYPYDEGKYLE